MQEWQYLVLTMDLAGGDRMRARWKNHAEIPNWKQGPEFYDYLDQLGIEGWEMVTAGALLTRHTSFVFKRPRLHAQ